MQDAQGGFEVCTTRVCEELRELTDGEHNVGTCGKLDVLHGTDRFTVIVSCHVFDSARCLRALVGREHSSGREWGSERTYVLETKAFDQIIDIRFP